MVRSYGTARLREFNAAPGISPASFFVCGGQPAAGNLDAARNVGTAFRGRSPFAPSILYRRHHAGVFFFVRARHVMPVPAVVVTGLLDPCPSPSLPACLARPFLRCTMATVAIGSHHAQESRLTRVAVKIGAAVGRADRKAHQIAKAGVLAKQELADISKQVDALKRQLQKTTKRLKRALS